MIEKKESKILMKKILIESKYSPIIQNDAGVGRYRKSALSDRMSSFSSHPEKIKSVSKKIIPEKIKKQISISEKIIPTKIKKQISISEKAIPEKIKKQNVSTKQISISEKLSLENVLNKQNVSTKQIPISEKLSSEQNVLNKQISISEKKSKKIKDTKNSKTLISKKIKENGLADSENKNNYFSILKKNNFFYKNKNLKWKKPISQIKKFHSD